MSDADVRLITESEFPDWFRANHIGFLNPPQVTPEDVTTRLKWTDLDRVRGAFDRDTGRLVATFRSFAQDLAVPGGARVAASAVTNVSVLATHRRQGLLSRMMADELTAARQRGEVVSTLIAAEYPIYGRYGYGPATSLVEWEVDVSRAGLDRRWARPECGGRIDFVEPADVREFGPELLERLGAGRAGVVRRGWWVWNQATGLDRPSFRPWTGQLFAAYRSPGGSVDGYVAYTTDETWTDAKIPLNTLTVHELLAATPDAERALWHYVCSMDWVMKVRTGYRAPDDLLPDLLPDPRAARTLTAADHLWVRLLDVPAALSARTYEAPGTLVLDVTDRSGLSGGRFRLDAAAGECEAVPDTVPADLRLDVAELGALYLGEGSVVRLAALGRVAEERPGAAALADVVFRTARRPWCPDIF
ncbi:GNAT family N-acetyltransferase [Streptomyces antimicrobicus]|uniref:GNAT family N-acetyltransferase n=1 Tax=Streptomyces antimicrobicus TaxID=2883108 RepID=A0ABS8B2R1_9ACTN|nr:GNAT family N-acetyltransferase [Streptomyces antimicrobicus]MCB5178901.1 GNAT family N-acetyltransferase [Streptomyces antimicrobicus]